ncbi:MAG: membrane protein YdbS with pleckstrin-like domain [Verrucomicrobiales bacterium]|jgi:membrane protein YdbS with pleckstrin-like domain
MSEVEPNYNRGLTPLHPLQKALIRTSNAIFWGVVLAAVALAEISFRAWLLIPTGLLFALTILAALFFILIRPERIYRRWGYEMERDQLRVLRGSLWRTDTIVPFNRIQHIDVAQGPLQRRYELSTLVVHTAGTHNSIVGLPGLHTPNAEAMRDIIKEHIREEMI